MMPSSWAFSAARSAFFLARRAEGQRHVLLDVPERRHRVGARRPFSNRQPRTDRLTHDELVKAGWRQSEVVHRFQGEQLQSLHIR